MQAEFQPKPARNKQFRIAGKQFEDFHEIDRQRDCNRADRVGEQLFQIALRQSAFTELRQRLKLPHAAAQLGLEVDPV